MTFILNKDFVELCKEVNSQKGRLDGAFMQDQQKIDLIDEIVDALLKREPLNPLANRVNSFDISRPNVHDSKKEYLAELEIVQFASKNATEIVELFLGSKDTEASEKTTNRIGERVNRSAWVRSINFPSGTASQLITKNASQTDFFWHMITNLILFSEDLEHQIKELKDQENEFWSVNGRPPNYFARTIALRLAKAYALEYGKKPTLGTSGDGGHPSTDFSRALEQIFNILKISADIRGPAKWAVEQLGDEDFLPPNAQEILKVIDRMPPEKQAEFFDKFAESQSKGPAK